MISAHIRGLETVQAQFRKDSEAASKAMVFAVNEGVRFGAAEASRIVRKKLNVNRAYLGAVTNKTSKIHISRKASAADPTASFTTVGRPFSLARFAGTPFFGRPKRGEKPTPVRVKVLASGGRKKIENAFFVKLEQGSSSDEGYNTGLAVRVKDGATLNKREFPAKAFAPNIYLLYGPEAYQVIESQAEALLPVIEDRVEAEFSRQFARLTL